MWGRAETRPASPHSSARHMRRACAIPPPSPRGHGHTRGRLHRPRRRQSSYLPGAGALGGEVGTLLFDCTCVGGYAAAGVGREMEWLVAWWRVGGRVGRWVGGGWSCWRVGTGAVVGDEGDTEVGLEWSWPGGECCIHRLVKRRARPLLRGAFQWRALRNPCCRLRPRVVGRLHMETHGAESKCAHAS